MIFEVHMYKNECYYIPNVDTFNKNGDDLYVYTGTDTSHEVTHCFYIPDIKSILITNDDE